MSVEFSCFRSSPEHKAPTVAGHSSSKPHTTPRGPGRAVVKLSYTGTLYTAMRGPSGVGGWSGGRSSEGTVR